jgi:hypothetical protein
MRLEVVLLASTLLAIAPPQDPAVGRIPRRLKPSAFPELPAAVRNELDRRGCTVPQPNDATHSANVIRGRFTSALQTDWAVLWSAGGISAILVFRGGSTATLARIAARPDSDERELGVANAAFIRQHYDWYGGPKPPPLNHDGIDDIVVEKASLVLYWYRGRWLELTGSN